MQTTTLLVVVVKSHETAENKSFPLAYLLGGFVLTDGLEKIVKRLNAVHAWIGDLAVTKLSEPFELNVPIGCFCNGPKAHVLSGTF